MGRKIRIKVHQQAIEQILKSAGALELVKGKVDRIAQACNSDSSWGGYYSSASVDSDRARGTAWSADARNDEARDQRLLKALDA